MTKKQLILYLTVLGIGFAYVIYILSVNDDSGYYPMAIFLIMIIAAIRHHFKNRNEPDFQSYLPVTAMAVGWPVGIMIIISILSFLIRLYRGIN